MRPRKTKKAVTPAWHPNFRNAESLPDIGAVRLGFFINSAAVLLFICVGTYTAFNEYQIYSANDQAKQLQEIIAEDGPANDVHLGKSKEFKTLGRELEQFTTFMDTAVRPSEILLDLSEDKPREVVLTSVRLENEIIREKRKEFIRPVVRIAGTVAGDSRTSTNTFRDFRDLVQTYPTLVEQIEEVQEFPSRNERLGVLEFELVLKLKTEQA